MSDTTEATFTNFYQPDKLEQTGRTLDDLIANATEDNPAPPAGVQPKEASATSTKTKSTAASGEK